MVADPPPLRAALRRSALPALALLLALAGCTTARAEDAAVGPIDQRRALHVQAAYLINFLRYCEWPTAAAAAAQPPLVVSVVGDDEVVETIAAVAALAGPVQGRPVLVRDVGYRSSRAAQGTAAQAEALQQLRESQLVFIDESSGRSTARLLQELRGVPVLTVSNVPGFVSRGGMLELFQYGRNIVFAANPAAIQQAGVQLSAKVLKLARPADDTVP